MPERLGDRSQAKLPDLWTHINIALSPTQAVGRTMLQLKSSWHEKDCRLLGYEDVSTGHAADLKASMIDTISEGVEDDSDREDSHVPPGAELYFTGLIRTMLLSKESDTCLVPPCDRCRSLKIRCILPPLRRMTGKGQSVCLGCKSAVVV